MSNKSNKGDYIMSYQEKRTLFTILSGLFILVTYGLYTYGRIQSGLNTFEDLRFWTNSMLMFIGMGIVITIIGQIVFHILIAISIAIKEKMKDQNTSEAHIEKTIQSEMVSDEMDKLIEMKSMQISFFFAGMGFVAGLILMAFDYSVVIMLNLLFVSFSLGSILEGIAQFVYYRKGLR